MPIPNRYACCLNSHNQIRFDKNNSLRDLGRQIFEVGNTTTSCGSVSSSPNISFRERTTIYYRIVLSTTLERWWFMREGYRRNWCRPYVNGWSDNSNNSIRPSKLMNCWTHYATCHNSPLSHTWRCSWKSQEEGLVGSKPTNYTTLRRSGNWRVSILNRCGSTWWPATTAWE